MEPPTEIKTITPALVIGFALACAALLPRAQAVSPPPDGGYAGNNTAEGTQALQSLTGGIDNTALGFQALFHNTTGNSNTAEGFRALFANTMVIRTRLPVSSPRQQYHRQFQHRQRC